MTSRDEILDKLVFYIHELFEIPTEKIVIAADLSVDLGLDSIDAVDLMLKLQEYTGKKISPAQFKSVRTVGDVVERIYEQLKSKT